MSAIQLVRNFTYPQLFICFYDSDCFGVQLRNMILSALVLTHCFGCIIPEDSDDDFAAKRPCNLSQIGDVSNERIFSETRPVVTFARAYDKREK